MGSLLELLSDMGKRMDGSRKGYGFFGPLLGSDGVSTELSFDFDFGGQNIHAPLLVPGLSREEINHLLSGQQPTEAIYGKAVQHALSRRLVGRNPFASPTDLIRLPR